MALALRMQPMYFLILLRLSIPDDDPSDMEKRWLLLGKNLNERLLLVVHTLRQDNFIRIISARKATTNESTTYMKRLSK
jgi:uncharacterized DUF497 family protein